MIIIKKLYVVFFLLLLTGCGQKSFITDLEPYAILEREPIQEKIEGVKTIVFDEDFEIRKLFTYKISAKVLGKEKYFLDKLSDVAQIDLALGWSKMSDNDLIEKSKIKIWQGARFYIWKIPSFSILSRYEVEHNSANVHIIAANSEVKKYINSMVSEDDYIYMEGFLVNVVNNSGGSWKTSTIRTDTGAGACEIFYVTKIGHLLKKD